MKNNYNTVCESQCQGQGHVRRSFEGLSFFQILDFVKEQVEFDCIGREDRALATELCFIIADIYRLPPKSNVHIDKNDLTAEMVAEIYQLITKEHIDMVIFKYKQIPYEIKFKTTYLRNMLYHIVFELEGDVVNSALRGKGK